jgi:hypothetical protein
MTAERGNIRFHIRMQRQGLQNFVKFRRAINLENADVRPLSDDAPEMEPWPVAKFLASIRPPCASTIDLQIAKPIPIPPSFVVKKLSNKRMRWSGGIPGPLSWTSAARVFSFSCVAMDFDRYLA